MAKDARLTLRITDELDAWLGTEAAKRGLDKAAFARMALYERMNGTAVLATGAATAPLRDMLDVTEQPAEPEPVAEVDIDALVSQQLEQAEAQGLTAPPPEDGPIDTSASAAGVRSLLRRPTPFTQALPGFLGPQQ